MSVPVSARVPRLQPAPLIRALPDETVEIAAMGAGTVVWDNGQVTVEAVGLQGEPVVR